MYESTERMKILQDNRACWVMCVTLSTADVGSAMLQEVALL